MVDGPFFNFMFSSLKIISSERSDDIVLRRTGMLALAEKGYFSRIILFIFSFLTNLHA